MASMFIGDLHCDKLTHKIPNFTKLVLNTLTATVQMGLERGISDLIIPGDVFDSPHPKQNTIVALLKTLSSFDCDVHVMLGNHDTADANTHSLQIMKWIGSQKNSNLRVITKPTTLTTDNAKLWLLPHPYVEDLPKGYLYGVGHFAVNGAKSDNGFTVRSKHCPKGKWILSDFHTPQAGRSNSCHFKYIGSLSQLSFAEGNKKRVLLIEDGELSSIKVPLSYTLNRITLSADSQLPDVSDRSVYWQIKYTGDYKFPTGWLSDNPNIVEAMPVSRMKNKKAQVLLENSEFQLNPLKPLESFLRTKKYTDPVVVRALELSEALRK